MSSRRSPADVRYSGSTQPDVRPGSQCRQRPTRRRAARRGRHVRPNRRRRSAATRPLLVEELTHNPLLSGLAFSAGFIALTLARSELFTENFLVPVVVLAIVGNMVGGLGLVTLLRLLQLPHKVIEARDDE
jgi:hypothetical protein